MFKIIGLALLIWVLAGVVLVRIMEVIFVFRRAMAHSWFECILHVLVSVFLWPIDFQAYINLDHTFREIQSEKDEEL